MKNRYSQYTDNQTEGQKQPYRILWRERADKGAVLLRMYGTLPQVTVPARIAGHPVVEVAPYCFSQSKRLFEGEIREERLPEDGSGSALLQELCGNFVEEVYLPDEIRKIGSCAFYNCRNLKILEIGTKTEDIGSDVFMNTGSFRRILLRCSAMGKSGIKQILSQITADIEVVFSGKRGVEALLLYPEYYEACDEIAPAHIFGRSIMGEGFRARQCIKDGVVDFAGYDGIFPQACVEESEPTLSRMALNRLRYPFALNGNHKILYQNYVSNHVKVISERFVIQKDLENLQFLCHEGLLRGQNLAETVQRAAESDWPEGAAYLLSQKSGQAQEEKKSRYEFDEF